MKDTNKLIIEIAIVVTLLGLMLYNIKAIISVFLVSVSLVVMVIVPLLILRSIIRFLLQSNEIKTIKTIKT